MVATRGQGKRKREPRFETKVEREQAVMLGDLEQDDNMGYRRRVGPAACSLCGGSGRTGT